MRRVPLTLAIVALLTSNLWAQDYALNDATGETLWQTRSPGAVGGGIVSYSTSSGDQRIAVAGGMVSPIWS